MILVKNKKRLVKCFFLIGTVFISLAGILFLYNILEDKKASQMAGYLLEQLHAGDVEPDIYIPDYILNPDMEMPTIEIDGDKYIGYLSFPSLELELPVMSSWSYAGFKKAPCLYTGSIYKGNAVIAAHNYTCHFGQLFNLEPGDPVSFIDADGNAFPYEIVIQEVLEPTAIDDMISSSYDLSLFTCTYGGSTRFTVRCRLL